MNDLFKELAIQAGACPQGGYVEQPDGGWAYHAKARLSTRDMDLQKFSESIVMRCASIVSLYRRDNMNDEGIADTLEMAYNEIKLSFGIK